MCIFRYAGADFEVDKWLSKLSLEPDRLYRRGENVHAKSTKLFKQSGFRIVFASTKDPLATQIEGCRYALNELRREFGVLKTVQEITIKEVDFAYKIKWSESSPNQIIIGESQSIFIPPDLMEMLAEFGISCKVSIYP